MKQSLTYSAEMSEDPVGCVTRLNHALERISDNLQMQKESVTRLERELEAAKEEAK